MNAYDISLPKWPAMLVVGQPVTPDQAFEILVKTDSYLPDFRYAGNAHRLCREYSKIFGIDDEEEKRLNPPGTSAYNPAYFTAIDDLRKRLGKIPLEYIDNSRIMSAWIGGPKGWVNWDGIVGCSGYNIGKWPSVEAVHREWEVVAAAFPYLDLTCWLFNGESCEEIQPVVKFVVKGGKAEVLPTSEAPVTPNGNANVAAFAASILQSPEVREVGLHEYPLVEGLKKLYGKIPRLKLKLKAVSSSCEHAN
jgi:hypothetical protein